MAAALAVSGLVKRYGAVEALGSVDLEVAPGELVGLLGPNGAGKSTLVKIACGLVRPTRGRAEICGAAAGSLAARRALGYLAELFRFPGWYTADEVLDLHQRLAGSAGGADERRRLLELVSLHDARHRRVEDMSKGMQQRLGVAQALVGSPRLLLLDEPTSAGGEPCVCCWRICVSGASPSCSTRTCSRRSSSSAIASRSCSTASSSPQAHRPSWRSRAASRSRRTEASAPIRTQGATTSHV